LPGYDIGWKEGIALAPFCAFGYDMGGGQALESFLKITKPQVILLFGDLIVLALVTMAGFATHQELDTAGLYMLTTYLPLSIAWLLISPHLHVYDPREVTNYRHLWRPFWAMVLAAPMAGWLRGMMLERVILPEFVLILGGISALVILAWRFLYLLVYQRKDLRYG
jgi:hypothetical protein